jgi:hypothetical protein
VSSRTPPAKQSPILDRQTLNADRRVTAESPLLTKFAYRFLVQLALRPTGRSEVFLALPLDSPRLLLVYVSYSWLILRTRDTIWPRRLAV